MCSFKLATIGQVNLGTGVMRAKAGLEYGE